MSGAGGWRDVSVPLRDGMLHWPDDPPVEVTLASSIAEGDSANVTRISASAHLGTHVDAPRHFLDGAAGVEALPLELAMGPARVLELDVSGAVSAEALHDHAPAVGERVLLRTRNSRRRWWQEEFDAGFAHLDAAAAEFLADARVALVGVDYLSVGDAATHRVLLGAGVWIVEGLDLTEVEAGDYELLCLPIRLVGSDGAPCRALLRARTGRTD